MSGFVDGRRLLTAALIGGLVATASPVPLFAETAGLAADSPRGFYVQLDGGQYHLDLDDAHRNYAAFAAGDGAYEIALRRMERGWRDVIVFSAERSAGHLSLDYRVGGDRLALSFPEAMLRSVDSEDAAAGGSMVVDVNGATVFLDRSWFDHFHGHAVAGRALEADALPLKLKEAFTELSDPRGFVDAWTTMARVAQRTSGPQPLIEASLNGVPPCLAPCTSCVRSAAMMGLSWVAILAACGPGTVGTSGLGFAVCIASLVGHGTIVGVAATSCGICLDCISAPEPGPTEPENPEDPDPICPPDMQPCCIHSCCDSGPGENQACK